VSVSPERCMRVMGIRSTRERVLILGLTDWSNVFLKALHIKAEVMRWVYTSGTEKPPPPPKVPFIKQQQQQQGGSKPLIGAGGFFSSLFSGFGGSGTPGRASVALPPGQQLAMEREKERERERQREKEKEALEAQKAKERADMLTVGETSVALSIFSADVNVVLEKKMAAELFRSTKKNPPGKLKYELIYVSFHVTVRTMFDWRSSDSQR
jgi:hypothetical protein